MCQWSSQSSAQGPPLVPLTPWAPECALHHYLHTAVRPPSPMMSPWPPLPSLLQSDHMNSHCSSRPTNRSPPLGFRRHHTCVNQNPLLPLHYGPQLKCSLQRDFPHHLMSRSPSETSLFPYLAQWSQYLRTPDNPAFSLPFFLDRPRAGRVGPLLGVSPPPCPNPGTRQVSATHMAGCLPLSPNCISFLFQDLLLSHLM